MKDKELFDELLKENVNEVQKAETLEKIHKAIENLPPKKVKRFRLVHYASAAAAFVFLLTAVLAVALGWFTKGGEKPIHYTSRDTEATEIDDVTSFYTKNIVLENFKIDFIKLYQTKDEQHVPVYLELHFTGNLIERDELSIFILLVENFTFLYEENFLEIFTDEGSILDLTINNKTEKINFVVNETIDIDYGLVFCNAKTKFKIEKYTYYITADYLKVSEDNLLEEIIKQLF